MSPVSHHQALLNKTYAEEHFFSFALLQYDLSQYILKFVLKDPFRIAIDTSAHPFFHPSIHPVTHSATHPSVYLSFRSCVLSFHLSFLLFFLPPPSSLLLPFLLSFISPIHIVSLLPVLPPFFTSFPPPISN